MYIDNNNIEENLFTFLKIDSKKHKIFFENMELLSYKLEEMILIEEKEEKKKEYRKEFETLYTFGKEIQLLKFSYQELENFRKKEYLEQIQKRKIGRASCRERV